MEVVKVDDSECRRADEPNDPEVCDAQDESDHVHEALLEDTSSPDKVPGVINDVRDVGESSDNIITASTVTIMDVVETSNSVLQSKKMDDIGNIVDGDLAQCSLVVESVPTSLEYVKHDWLDYYTDNKLLVKDEIIENAHNTMNETGVVNNITIDVNKCDLVVDKTNKSIGINNKKKTILNQASDRKSVPIKTENPGASLEVKNDKILEDFETIESADTDAGIHIIKDADANIIQIFDASDLIVDDFGSNQCENNDLVVDKNGEQLTKTPKLDPETGKHIQEISRPKQLSSHDSKSKFDTGKKIIGNDIISVQKRKKTDLDYMPKVKNAMDCCIKSYTSKRQPIIKIEPTNDESICDTVNKVESETNFNNVAKSSKMREVNKLLGDEGAVNMIYSLGKRRTRNNNSMKILPSSKQTKKDLMFKTKLVKDSLFKTSAPTSSPRSTNILGRHSVVRTPYLSPNSKRTKKRSINSQDDSDDSIFVSSRESIFGNESKIYRKHSSSSEASSLSNSPIHPAPCALPINNKVIERTSVKKLRVSTENNKNSEGLSVTMDQLLDEMSKGTNQSVEAKRALAGSIIHEVKSSSYNEITVRQYDGVVHIILTPVTTVMKNALNISVMEELMKELNGLQNDDTCKVVLVTSTGKIFCQGLDVSSLIHNDPEKCKKAAVQISSTLKKFITCLNDFPKLLVAGVNGAAVGLGATLLTHFDLVLASDNATFETPYAQLGHIAEGAATTILSRHLVTELILGNQRLSARQAYFYGLVTRTFWSDQYDDELISLVKELAKQSLQFMKVTKTLRKQKSKEKLEDALESETHILVQQWTDSECQQNFQLYLKDVVVKTNSM